MKASALPRKGWTVRALTRDIERAARNFAHLGPIEWMAGDAVNPADVVSATTGASVVVHAANPPARMPATAGSARR